MDRYGITAKGFRRPLYQELLERKLDKAVEVFGTNIDTSETSFLGELIRIAAWNESTLWEELEELYFTPFVNTAEGRSLDSVGMYLTITRRPAIKSKGIVTIYGTDETVVPKGFRVETKKGEVFQTTEEVEIKNGKVNVEVESLLAGKDSNVAKGRITEITNPMIGVDSVENFDDTDGGLDIETDEEFRARYKKSYSRAGGSTVPALTAALLDTDGVVDAEVVENVTMKEVDGIPPKAFESFVYGGEHEDIVHAIYVNKPAGIEAFGEIIEEVEDDRGRVHKIGYTRATVVDIWVRLKITRGEDYKGDEYAIRTVLNYIGGIDTDGIEYTGLKLGQNVVYNKLVSAIMCPGGITDIEVEVSTDGRTWTKDSIDIDKNAIARIRPDRIEIIYV